MFETPILLILFNRPETTRKTFEVISRVRPQYLYIAGDGPRPDRPSDFELCMTARSVIKQIDWPCELHTLFRDENRGCGHGPAEAITWFFEQVEEGIILEDDCLPHEDFFYYCKDLLELYRTNPKISFIGGTNFQDGLHHSDASYYFSAGNQGTWGWASWKRAWNGYDYYLTDLDFKTFNKALKYYFNDNRQIKYWCNIFTKVKIDQFGNSCWDYQFYFNVWRSGALAVIPNVNLVTNIGFDNDATHTYNSSHSLANNRSHSILPLVHPSVNKQNKVADLYLHKTHLEPNDYKDSCLLWFLKKTFSSLKSIFSKCLDLFLK